MTQQSKKQEKRKNSKLIIALILIFAAVAITIGVIFAFFSDVITGSGSATSGTLDLQGSFNYQINGGTSTPIATAINNLNPGDAVYISASITNVGNKSSWVRGAFEGATIDSNLKPYIYIYNGNVTQTTLLALENAQSTNATKDAALCGAAGYVAGGNGGTGCTAFAASGTTGVGTVSILNGTGTGAELDGVNGPITFGFTIYFAGYAPNMAQGRSLSIGARVEGLQYRNNPGVTLTDARWATAVNTPGIN